jgi:serine/threonine protein kinase
MSLESYHKFCQGKDRLYSQQYADFCKTQAGRRIYRNKISEALDCVGPILKKLGYKIPTKPIGFGTMGTVFQINSKLVVKVTHHQNAKNLDNEGRLGLEASQINVGPKVHTFGHCRNFEDSDYIEYIVMDNVSGRSLSNISSGNYTPQLLINILNQWLKLFKDKNICHRDLKGDNVIITSTGDVVLIDYGIARKCQTLQEDDPSILLTSTLGGNTDFGTQTPFTWQIEKFNYLTEQDFQKLSIAKKKQVEKYLTDYLQDIILLLKTYKMFLNKHGLTTKPVQYTRQWYFSPTPDSPAAKKIDEFWDTLQL